MEQHSVPTETNHVDEEMLADVLTLLNDEAPDGLLKACSLFRSSVPERFVDIEAGLTESRFDAVARAAHSLRGSAGAFGACGLSSLAARLEELCDEPDRSAAALLLAQMRAEFVVFCAILDLRLAELSA